MVVPCTPASRGGGGEEGGPVGEQTLPGPPLRAAPRRTTPWLAAALEPSGTRSCLARIARVPSASRFRVVVQPDYSVLQLGSRNLSEARRSRYLSVPPGDVQPPGDLLDRQEAVGIRRGDRHGGGRRGGNRQSIEHRNTSRWVREVSCGAHRVRLSVVDDGCSWLLVSFACDST